MASHLMKWLFCFTICFVLGVNFAEEQCDEDRGFIKVGSNCFSFVDQHMSWHDANEYCIQEWDSYLASVISEEEQIYIAGLSDVDLWIGLSDTESPGTLQWINGHDHLEYTMWNSGEPVIENQGSTCVKTLSNSNGEWKATRCSQERSFVCKKGVLESCPDGWSYSNKKCYLFYLNDNLFATWTEARDLCETQNARMLKITSDEDQQYISNFFPQWRDDGILQMWLGISDVFADDKFVWTDGTAVDYTQWDICPDEGKHTGVDDCTWIYTGKTQSNWEIGNCFQLQPFGCEINEGISLSPIPKPVFRYKCDKGWRLFKDHCYLFSGDKKNWDGAEAVCYTAENSYGHLASVLDEDENSFMSGNLKGQSWIGMSDRAVEGTWVWTDGSPTDFFNWKNNQPKQDGDCMRLIGTDDDNQWGTWNDYNCTVLAYPICKINAAPTAPYTPTIDTDPNESICGTGYYHNSGTHKCYKIVSDYIRPWADARLHCQQDGGELLSINSPEEQAFIEFHLAYLSVGSLWIGALDSYNGPDFFPSVVQDSFDGGWRWSDDSPFNFVNWNAGEPNSQGDEGCVEIFTGSGLWNDIDCSRLYGYICEKEDPQHEEPVADCTSEDCCFRHLGVEVGGSITDDQLSASSRIDRYSGAARGRLNILDEVVDLLNFGKGRGGWIANSNDAAPWFRIDLLDWYEVRGVVSQGRNGLNQPNNQNNWVKQYSVQYMINPYDAQFEDYKDLDGSVMIFDGNYDQDDQVTNIFKRPIVTTAIKILPTKCRINCAMRIELIGCLPTCISSLGLSTNFVSSSPTSFPILDDTMFSASSEQVGYEAYNARLDYVESQATNKQHYTLDDATMTYDSARAYCVSKGADLCLRSDICVNGVPDIIGTQQGDHWAPIRDGYNDWVEIGDDGTNRLCYRHNEHYSPPSWGITTGECPPWNTKQTCDLKGNVFCCPVNLKSWKPSSNSVSQWLQIDLGDFRKISGILVQGGAEADDWMTSYYMSFSEDGSTFSTYMTPSGTKEVFPGSTDRVTPVEGYLREPISTRYIRILPQSWHNNIAIRMDVIGCNVGDRGDCTDRADAFTQDSFTINCPSGCGAVADRLWGTEVYTDDSYICAAAIHDGRFVADHGGAVSVKKINGKDSYTGSIQHGLVSQDYGSWPGSFIFQGDHLGCPTGWDGWKDWCYYLTRKSSKVDYSSARQRCQHYGGDLASIHDQAEQDFVTNLMFYGYGSIDNVWIGMTDLERTNYFKWEDGSDVTYTRWDFNEPNGGDIEHCVHLYKWSGFWNDHSCDTVMNYMCKMDKIPVNQAQVSVDGCPTDWVGWEASCYLFDITPSVWTNAEDFCSDQGGHLVSIGSYYEQMFITSQAAQTSHPDDHENFYIGLGAFVDPSGSLAYRWSSGEPVTFTAWDKDEPFILHQCTFPFQYQGVEYYDCISFGRPYELLGGPWCSADAIYSDHPVPCEGMDNGQVGCIVLDKDTGYWSQANPIGCGSPEYRICEIPRQGYTTAQIPTLPSPNGNCPTGWFGSSKGTFCYQINEKSDVADKLTWEQAKFHCESQGSNLASFHSTQEEDIIVSGVQGTNGDYSFWIGLKRQDDGMMGWSDKTPLSYTNWDVGEPNNHNGRENCVESYFKVNETSWNDLNCDAVRNWICKVERGKQLITPGNIPTGTLSPQICGSDVAWVAYTSSYTNQQKCYYFASSPIQSWYQSNIQCQSLGGSLVSIATLDEQEFVTGRVTKTTVSNLWIGLAQDTMYGPFIWVDGSPVTFENWMGGGQPDNNNGQELCVEVSSNTGLWSDANCGLGYGFICEKLVGAKPVTPDPTPILPGGCPFNWLLYGSKCFLEVGFTDQSLRSNWEDAETYCETNNGFLASVTNEYYSAFLTSQLFASPSNIWIGLNSRGTDLTFKWSDNSDVQYTNWAPGEPNNSEGGEECVQLRWQASVAGDWNDYRCKETLPFFCSRDKSIEFSPDYQGDLTICPDGHDFIQWDTGCYKIYRDVADQKTWNDAKDKCKADGQSSGFTMDLASVWNVYENNFIKSFFWPQESSFNNMYLGMYYTYNSSTGENAFKWSDHSPNAYTRWGTNEPQIPTSDMGCVVMDRHGTWLMMSQSQCESIKMPFVCKYETLTIPAQDPGVGTCEEHWIGFGDYCYLVVPGHNSLDLRSWGDADRECQTRTGYLGSIHSDIENKAFISWTDQKNVWIGLQRNGWGGWDWSDKTAVDFTYWAEGEPNNSGESGEACVELYTNGGWNDNYCSGTRGYVCKKHKSYSTCAFPNDQREDCGYDGISNYECLSRGCCWDEAGLGPHACFYSKADAACIEKGGACKNYRYNVCELGYEKNLCSGGNENQCCFSCATDDSTCQQQVQDWNNGDSACESGGYGLCQDNSNYCVSNVYESGKCGGPANRQCCVANPPTKPSDLITTTTKGNNVPPVTDPGQTTTTQGQVVVTTYQTSTPTVVIQPSKGGLDGGAIAGIVIAVLIVVAGIGVLIYFFQRGDVKMPSVDIKVPFSSSSKNYNNGGGFSNPIIYSQDSISMGKDSGEFDA